MFKKTVLLLSLALGAVSGQAFAAPHYEISPNRISKIATVYIHDAEACRLGSAPRVKLVNQPAHGKVLVRWAHAKRDCNGTAGVVVSFKPDRNYRGMDYFIARFATRPSQHAKRNHMSAAYGFSICVE